MAAKMKRLFYKLILISALLLLCLMTAAGVTAQTAVALDQQVRCGMPEHTHTQECYLEGVLMCRQKAHTHDGNCYLVLLEDNDVNWLLQAIDDSGEKSLEGVLDSAMGQALTLNENLSGESPPLSLTAQDISSLNNTIEDNNIEPGVVLNENLRADTYLNYSPGASTFAVGDRPATGTRAVNFYILLDGKITLIGSGTLTNSSPDYYSYSDIVKEYTDVVNTGLKTSNINSTYFFRYNTNGNVAAASNFNTVASCMNNRVRMGSTNDVRYVLLMHSQAAVAFYTVTLDYSQAEPGRSSQQVYVESGRSSGLTLSDAYLWYDADGNQVTALPSAITKTTTLYAKPKAYTVTFEDKGGNALTSPYTGQPENGILTVIMPQVAGKKTWYWIEKGSNGVQYYQSGQAVEVTGNTAFVAIPDTYTITWIDDTGQTRTQTVGYRQTVTFDTLPEGWFWVGAGGIRYDPGDQSPIITSDLTFTAASRIVNVHYNVNFPAGAVNVVDFVPTIYGTDSTTATTVALGGRSMTILDLTSRTARREISSGNKESVTYYFKGWTVAGTDVLIPPDTNLSWSDLTGYIAADGEIRFQGVWEEGNRYNSATFFVRFDSAAVDTNGNITSQPTENYTPEVFNTHVGGINTSMSDTWIRETYEIADTTSDNSFGADQAIRALYGEKASGAWLYDFPSDDHVFTYLKQYLAQNPGKQLTVEGNVVDPNQLNHS